jgi:hypothetical protein
MEHFLNSVEDYQAALFDLISQLGLDTDGDTFVAVRPTGIRGPSYAKVMLDLKHGYMVVTEPVLMEMPKLTWQLPPKESTKEED